MPTCKGSGCDKDVRGKYKMCDPCRARYTAYVQKYRDRHPGLYAKSMKKINSDRSVALKRYRDLIPAVQKFMGELSFERAKSAPAS